MSGLRQAMNLIFVEDSHARLHGGLGTACASAALGRQVRLFFQGAAVAALARRDWPEDAAHVRIGSPSIADLLAQCAELDIPISACETGLHLAGLTAADLPEHTETCGLVAFLADRAEMPVILV